MIKYKNKRLKKLYIYSLGLMLAIMCATLGALILIISNACESYLLDETAAFISINAEQLKLNINAHLEGIEKNVALMFADDDFVEYDPSVSTLEDFDRVQLENSIANRIVDLGALQNYSDFFVLYSNDKTVGWRSKTTQNMYPNGGLYEAMSKYITNEKSQDGWCYGVNGNMERMYYIKRYNSNALIVASFYTRELEETFQYPTDISNLEVRLADDRGYIVYSSNTDEIGTKLPEQEMSFAQDKQEISGITEHYIVNTGLCDNGWTVICFASRDTTTQMLNDIKRSAYLISLIVVLASMVMLIILARRIVFRPMKGYVDDLSEKAVVDVLSGVLNRRGFVEMVDQSLEQNVYSDSGFILFDVDNFKQINDNLGHEVGDTVISRMGQLLKDTFVDDKKIHYFIGRLGGDEFAVFAGTIGTPKGSLPKELENKLNSIGAAFKQTFERERETVIFSLSAGVVMKTDTGSTYQNLYSAADSALYHSKESGKNRYTFFSEIDGGSERNE